MKAWLLNNLFNDFPNKKRANKKLIVTKKSSSIFLPPLIDLETFPLIINY